MEDGGQANMKMILEQQLYFKIILSRISRIRSLK
jgi:hypothetical protein